MCASSGADHTVTITEVILPSVRPAEPDDVDAVLAFWVSAAENDDRPADRRDAVVRLVGRDPSALLLAVDETGIVGTVIAGWDGWRAHLYRLAVRPDRRREGIAGLLLDAAERRLAALGATRFDAMVLEANDGGHGLWAHAGYARQATWGRWVKPAG